MLKKILCQFIIYIFAFLCLLFNVSAGNDSFTLQEQIKVPSLGMSIKTFAGYASQPIQFPESYILGGSTDKAYKFNDLWRYKQYCGSWGDGRTELLIAEMSIDVPKKIPEYTFTEKPKQLNENTDSIKWSDEKQKDWLELFSEKKLSKGRLIYSNSHGLKIKYYAVLKSDENKSYKDCFFTIPHRNTKKIIVLRYKIKFSDFSKNMKAMIYKSLKSIRFYSDGEILDKTYDPGDRSNENTHSTEYNAVKEKVLQNIKNLKDWWYLDSDHFIIVTNLPEKSKKFIYNLRERLELLHKLYGVFYKAQNNNKEINVVRVFAERNDYLKYIGEEHQWTAGLWMPGKGELVISPYGQGNSSEQESKILSLVNHEAFHQYLHYAVNQKRSSAWFNEGNATFFEGAEFKNRKIDIEKAKYFKHLQKMINARYPINLKNFLYMDYLLFYGKNNQEALNHYSIAWGLIYFLWKGSPYIKLKTGHDYTSILHDYYKALLKTGNDEQATAEAWKSVNMDTFTKEFIKFYKSDAMLNKAEKYNVVKELLQKK